MITFNALAPHLKMHYKRHRRVYSTFMVSLWWVSQKVSGSSCWGLQAAFIFASPWRETVLMLQCVHLLPILTILSAVDRHFGISRRHPTTYFHGLYERALKVNLLLCPAWTMYMITLNYYCHQELWECTYRCLRAQDLLIPMSFHFGNPNYYGSSSIIYPTPLCLQHVTNWWQPYLPLLRYKTETTEYCPFYTFFYLH